jgi:hypothetical protein
MTRLAQIKTFTPYLGKSRVSPPVWDRTVFTQAFRNLYKSQLLGPNHIRMMNRGLRDTLPRVILFLNAHVQLPTFGRTDFREVISNLHRSSNHL